MPDAQTVQRPKTQPELILKLIDAMPHPRNRALLAVGCFCGPRTSESLGLTWKSYARVPDRQRRPGLRRGCAFCRSLRIRHQGPRADLVPAIHEALRGHIFVSELHIQPRIRSEERRVGKECRSRW